MNDEAVTPSVEPEQPTATQSEAAEAAPTDFREYAAWRKAGGTFEAKEPAAPAAAEERALESAPEPPAKTEPDSEPEQPPATEADDDEAEPGKGGSRQRKIDRLRREKAEVERQLAELKRLQPPPAAPAPAPEAGVKTLDDFPDVQSYLKYELDRLLAQEEAKRTVERTHEAFSRRQTEARKAHADYDDVISSIPVPDGPGLLDARMAMLEDPDGAEILYYLGQHPDELKKIVAMPPRSAVRAIGRIAAQVSQPKSSSEATNGKRTVTRAFPPPTESTRPAKPMTDTVEAAAERKDFRAYERLRKAQSERQR